MEGFYIYCKVCNEAIVIDQGYRTCEDACDFDVHVHCYGEGVELAVAAEDDGVLKCRGRSVLVKREAGFRKLTMISQRGHEEAYH